MLKHTSTLFALSDHYILSRKWRVLLIKYRPIIVVGQAYTQQTRNIDIIGPTS